MSDLAELWPDFAEVGELIDDVHFEGVCQRCADFGEIGLRLWRTDSAEL